MLIPRPKIWTPRWPSEVRRYLHLRRDSRTGHLDKADNGDDAPDQLVKGDCCCRGMSGSPNNWDCCFSGGARPGIVRYFESTCWWEDEDCETPSAPSPPTSSGHWLEFNGGDNIDTDRWIFVKASENACTCWVTKDKYTVNEYVWDHVHGSGCPNTSGTIEQEGDAYVFIRHHGLSSNDFWQIGYHSTSQVCADADWRPMQDSGGSVPLPPDAGDNFEGCCGDDLTWTADCVKSGTNYFKWNIDMELTVVNNKCCRCGEYPSGLGDCVVTALDYSDSNCDDGGDITNVCSSSDPDQDDSCP